MRQPRTYLRKEHYIPLFIVQHKDQYNLFNVNLNVHWFITDKLLHCRGFGVYLELIFNRSSLN